LKLNDFDFRDCMIRCNVMPPLRSYVIIGRIVQIVPWMYVIDFA